jgi:lia operon protein LiaG
MNRITIKKLAGILGIIFIVSGLVTGMIFFTQYNESGFSFENFENIENYENSVDVEKKTAIQGIDMISVETTSTDIKLVSIDSNEIKAHLYGGYSSSSESFKPELSVVKNGSKLNIKIENNSDKIVYSSRSNLHLDVYVPSQYSESVEVKSESGVVTSNDLSVKEISLGTSSGDINASDINAEKANFDTSSGNVTFNGKFTKLYANSTSGDIISDGIEAEYSKFESSSGEIRFKGTFTEVNAKSTSGDIISDSTKAKSSEFESSSGKIAVSGNLSNSAASSNSGDISLSTSERPQSIQIKTFSGNASLKLPDSAGFKLECESTSGKINSDFPVTVITSGNNSRNELNGTVGDGNGTVKINTSSGDIHIQK